MLTYHLIPAATSKSVAQQQNQIVNSMEVVLKDEDMPLHQIALYASISFLIVTLLGIFLYITCSKKYKLNWFEKNLLETASETQELNQSNEALVSSIPYNVDQMDSTSIRSLNRSPVSTNDDPTFWVPQQSQLRSGAGTSTGASGSGCGYGGGGGGVIIGGDTVTSADESLPATPTSPTGSHNSMALSIASSTNTVPIARGDKHVVLAMSPARPKVASMQSKLDHTKIDTSLYDNETVSMDSTLPEDIRGTIHLTLNYDLNAGILTVRLVEAQDLQPRDFSGTADPYAKVRLLPDRTNIWQTRIHKKTLNPVFDEDFVFEERPTIIGRRTIEILLYDFDAYSRHVCIGGTQIDLSQVDLSKKVDLWNPLVPCAEQNRKVDLGDLMVSMSYLPSAERLTVIIIKARNLRVVDESRNASDPYVRVSLIHHGKKIKKKKTGAQRGTVCPTFNEALTFDISKDTLRQCTIEFSVFHDSLLLATNEILGRAYVGNSSKIKTDERAFFEEMFRSKTATAQWISLTDASVISRPPALLPPPPSTSQSSTSASTSTQPINQSKQPSVSTPASASTSGSGSGSAATTSGHSKFSFK